MQDDETNAAKAAAPIAQGQRVAAETVHVERADGRIAASFRLPLAAPPEPQMSVETDIRAAGEHPVAPVDAGLLADGPSVWEAVDDDDADPGAPAR
jgi:hypothetical protein